MGVTGCLLSLINYVYPQEGGDHLQEHYSSANLSSIITVISHGFLSLNRYSGSLKRIPLPSKHLSHSLIDLIALYEEDNLWVQQFSYE